MYHIEALFCQELEDGSRDMTAIKIDTDNVSDTVQAWKDLHYPAVLVDVAVTKIREDKDDDKSHGN